MAEASSCRHKKGKCFKCGECIVCGECKCDFTRQTRRRKASHEAKRERERILYLEASSPSPLKRQQEPEPEGQGTDNPCVALDMDADEGDESILQSISKKRTSSGKKKTATTFGELKKVSQVKKLFGIDEKAFMNMPSISDRTNIEFDEMDDRKLGIMVGFTEAVLKSLCQIVYPADSNKLAAAVASKLSGGGRKVGDAPLLSNMKSIISVLPLKSVQRKVLMAPICATYPMGKTRAEIDVGVKQFNSSRRHFEFMSQGEELLPALRYIMGFKKKSVLQAVNFILDDTNVQLVSWGTKKIILDGHEIDFPRLVRREVVERLSIMYAEYYPEKDDRIGSTSFKKIAKAITCTDQKAKTAVDYVSNILLYDNFDMLRKIATTSNIPDELEKVITALEVFLKGGYDGHINSCNVTKKCFALSDKSVAYTCSCSICDIPCNIIAYIQQHIPVNHHALLNDCNLKLKLYCGHRIRVLAQREAIDKLLQRLPSDQAHIVMDFKMKFEAMYYREKTLDFYGKKGLSWHGGMIYRRYTEDEKVSIRTTTKKEPQQFHIQYYDHISAGDTTQDFTAVLAYFEASCIRLAKDHAHIKKVSAQTDNARCYKSPELLLTMYKIAKYHGLELVIYIHTGVQDGKGPIDGHFATAMAHVQRFCNTGNDILTPEDIVTALRSNGGVNNSLAEMVAVNRDAMQKFVALHEPLIKRLVNTKKDFEVHFDNISESLTSFQYSGVGRGETVSLSPAVDITIDVTNEADTNGCPSEDGDDDGDDSDDDMVADIIEDYNVDLEDEDKERLVIGGVTGCTIFSAEDIAKKRVRVVMTKRVKITPPDDIECDDDSDKCGVCNKVFKHEFNMAAHKCKLPPEARDILTTAFRIAVERVHQPSFHVIQGSSNDDALKRLESIPMKRTGNFFQAGWARVPKQGHMYGRKYIKPFKPEIENMFEEGVRDKSKRLGPARMLQQLRIKHPGRLDLPAESEIRQLISTLTAKGKKAAHGTPASARKTGIQAEYREALETMVLNNPSIKPMQAWKEFQIIHPYTEDQKEKYPKQNQVKARVYILRKEHEKQKE